MNKHSRIALCLMALLTVTLCRAVRADGPNIGYGGIGLLAGKSDGKNEMAGALEFGGAGQTSAAYGQGALRLEGGSGWGISGYGFGGATLTGLERGEPAALLFGLEPLNLAFTANSNDKREDFIEWLPMVSLGGQLAADSCRILALARAGGALGTLGKNGAGYAYGGGAYVNCRDFFLTTELTRIDRKGQATDMAAVDTMIPIKAHRNVFLGLRGEVLDTREADGSDRFGSLPNDGDRVEGRVMLTLKSRGAR